MTQTINHREEWLARASMEFVIPLIESKGGEVPAKVRYTCGWPSTRAMSVNNQRIGECWYPKCSADGTSEVIVSMGVDEPVKVLATLLHEVIHTVTGAKTGHGKEFRRLAVACGLEGKMTATVAGEGLTGRLNGFLEGFPKYPHAAVTGNGERKKQGTRMLKGYCPDCVGGETEYIIRLSRKVAGLGLPNCPVCGSLMVLD